MLETFSLFYDLLILSVFVVTITISGMIYFTKDNKNCRLIACLFLVFTLDHIVIMLTELIPSFGEAYERIFLSIPSVKLIVYAFSFFYMIQLMKANVPTGAVMALQVLMTITIIIMLFIPMMKNSALKSWLFFFPAQVFLFIYALVGILELKRGYATNTVGWDYPFLGRMFFLMLVFSLLIVAEDTYVIFRIDEYTDRATRIVNRNYSEDLMRLLLSALSVRTLLTMMKRVSDGEELVNAVTLSAEQAQVPVSKQTSALEPTQTSALEPAPVSSLSPAQTSSDVPMRSQTDDADSESSLDPGQLPVSAAEAAAEVSKKEAADPVFAAFCQKYQLTGRETEILSMILKSMTNQEISDSLYLSLGTTKTHTHNIFSKLDVTRRKEVFMTYARFKEHFPE